MNQMPLKDPEKRKEYNKKQRVKWVKDNPNYQREYYTKHKKRINRRLRKWRKQHPEYREYSRKNYQKNTEERAKQHKEQRKKLKLKVFELLGNKCVNPYNLEHGDFLSDPRCLQIDHIHGDGHKDRKARNRSQTKLYRQILEHPEDYQLLCANCNWIKRYENKEYSKLRKYKNKNVGS